MKHLLKFLILTFIYGFLYYCIEMIYRGYSHWSMFILSGISCYMIGKVNEKMSWSIPVCIQSIIGGLTITSGELIFGIIFNIILKMNIWDYSNMWMNFYGQICPLFFIIWCFLSIIIIFLDDWLRYIMFNECKPKYKLL